MDVQPDYFQKFSEVNPKEIQLIGLKHVNLKKESAKIHAKLQKAQNEELLDLEIEEVSEELDDVEFVHLHNHSQFSVLQSTISIKNLVASTAKHKMSAVALTDHANMMGAFHFVKEINLHNKNVQAKNKEAISNGELAQEKEIKPIIGCEFFVCEDHLDKTRKDNGYQIVLIAKNKNGYYNLAKLSSIAYTQGFYYVPRIDKELIQHVITSYSIHYTKLYE